MNRPWFKKKRFLLPATVFAITVYANSGTTPQSASIVDAPRPSIAAQHRATPAQVSEAQSVAPERVVTTPTPPILDSGSAGNGYTNVDGAYIPSPRYSNTVPAGASAQCGDGTYSFSTHRSGTCSHHGGVATWL